jgi:hypothetical protein
MTEISKIELANPDAKLMLIQHGYIQNNTLLLNKEKLLFLPTMYCGWRKAQRPQVRFASLPSSAVECESFDDDILFLFDTWGTSSYYHLLVDHILPLWITTQVVYKYLEERNITVGKAHFVRVSKNNYNNELGETQSIFSHFLKTGFSESTPALRKYKYIVYGYCYTYRPFKGQAVEYFANYQPFIDRFCETFKTNELSTPYILLCQRQTRNYVDVPGLETYLLSQGYAVKRVDFSQHSIEEQIELCAHADIMIGSEGAAFANQLFLARGSLIVSIAEDPTRNYFHSSLSQYLKHDFHSIDARRTKWKFGDLVELINAHRRKGAVVYQTC